MFAVIMLNIHYIENCKVCSSLVTLVFCDKAVNGCFKPLKCNVNIQQFDKVHIL